MFIKKIWLSLTLMLMAGFGFACVTIDFGQNETDQDKITQDQTAQIEAPQNEESLSSKLLQLLPWYEAQAESDEDRLIVYTALDPADWPRHLESFATYPGLFQRQCPDLAINPEQVSVEIQDVENGKLYTFDPNHPDCPGFEMLVESDSTGIVADKFLAEKEDPRADVIWALATTSLLRSAAEGMLEPFEPLGLDRVNPRMRDFNNPPLFVGTDVFMSVICVNTDKLAAAGLPMPTDWADLTDPIYKNQLVMPDPSSSGTGFIAVAAFLQGFGEEEGWAKLDALHENIRSYTRSGSQPCRLVGQDQIPTEEEPIPIGISFGQAAVSQRAQGFPVVGVFPREGSGWELNASALVKKNIIKPAARTFLDWAISDEAMRSYATVFPVTSVETDVPLPDGYAQEPIKQLMENWRFIWLTANQDRIKEEWIERYGSKSEVQEIQDAFR